MIIARIFARGNFRARSASAVAAFVLAAALPIDAERAVTAPALEGFPFSNESLNYSVNLPSGISMGEAHLTAKRDPARGWAFNLAMDASLPNFPIVERYVSASTTDLCSIRSERSSERGSKKTKEFTVIDRTRSLAVRATAGGGGLTEIQTSICPHDALTFLYYMRRELGQGKVPPSDTILVGAAYRISMVYAGEKAVERNNAKVAADQINCTIRGPASEVHLEVLFARDAARTPLVLRCPLSAGTFSLELIR